LLAGALDVPAVGPDVPGTAGPAQAAMSIEIATSVASTVKYGLALRAAVVTSPRLTVTQDGGGHRTPWQRRCIRRSCARVLPRSD
jgi:hypothetical protein